MKTTSHKNEDDLIQNMKMTSTKNEDDLTQIMKAISPKNEDQPPKNLRHPRPKQILKAPLNYIQRLYIPLCGIFFRFLLLVVIIFWIGSLYFLDLVVCIFLSSPFLGSENTFVSRYGA